jgi:general L-amino acid transport system substrate-binding protein
MNSLLSRALLTLCVLLCAANATPANASPAGPTLARIRAAGNLPCGVNFEEAEYSTQDAHGNHSALDLDLCKAIAVAVLGPGAKFTALPYRDEQDALKGLRSGEIAVLATASPNFMNTAAGGFGFSRPIFYDYQGFLVNKSIGIHASKDLAGKKICFLGGTEIQSQVQGYMQRQSIPWLPFPFQEKGEMEAAFITGNCAAVTADVSQLAYERIAFRSMASQFEILPEVIAKDPLAPAYRLDDHQWAAIANWVVEALIQAEESGVTQANLLPMLKSGDPVVLRLLDVQRGYGQYLALDDSWAAHVIEAVGNYGELFERDLGSQSVMRLVRGQNNLWSNGGLMVASPIR